MPRIFKRRIRRRTVRKFVWITISLFATLGLVMSTIAPQLAVAF